MQAFFLCEFLKLAENDPVSVDGRFLELSCFPIRNEILPCLLDRDLFGFLGLDFTGGLLLEKPLARPFPVEFAERLADVITAQGSVYPDRASAAPIFPSVLPMSARLLVTPVKCQH